MSFVLGELAATYVDIGIKAFVLVPFFVVAFLILAIKRKHFRECLGKYVLRFFFWVLVFLIAFFNTKDYAKDINTWEMRKVDSKVRISGYIDEIFEKENVVYIYVDDVFILADYDVYEGLYIGNYIEVKGLVKHFEVARNEGNFDEKSYYNSIGLTKKIEAADIRVIDGDRDKLKDFIGSLKTKYVKSIHNIWNEDTADIICAVTVGDKNNLSDDVKERYRVIGISHVLAISGLHLSIIGMGLFKLFRRRFGYFISGVAGIFVVLLFGVCIGDSASIQRATFMFVMHIIALILGRTYDMISATSLAALLLLFECPYVMYNAGFILSFGAIIAICIITNIIEKPNVLVITGGIQCITLPLTMQLFYEIPLYGLLVNLVVIPTVGVLVISGLLSGIVGIFSLKTGAFMSGIGKLILWFYERIYDVVERLPYNNIVTGRPKLWLMFVFYIAIFVVMLIMYYRKRQFYMVFTIPIVILFLFFNKDRTFYISAIDVGQGDCILIHNEDCSVYMIDAGSSDVKELYEYKIKSTLKAKGIDRIDGFIITHVDFDHISAVKDMIEEGMICNLYLPWLNNKSEEYLEVVSLAGEYGVEVKYLYAGMKLADGEMKLKCLYPFEDSTSEDINELSTVIKLEYGGMSVLCMGDLGEMGERTLVARYSKEELDCDILKVGHHGSKNSSSMGFLEMVTPHIAVISCSEDNSYGHPHTETLERLREVGSKILITKDCGEVRLEEKER